MPNTTFFLHCVCMSMEVYAVGYQFCCELLDIGAGKWWMLLSSTVERSSCSRLWWWFWFCLKTGFLCIECQLQLTLVQLKWWVQNLYYWCAVELSGEGVGQKLAFIMCLLILIEHTVSFGRNSVAGVLQFKNWKSNKKLSLSLEMVLPKWSGRNEMG